MRPNPETQQLLLAEQVRLLFSAIPNSFLANMAGSFLAIIMYQEVVSPVRLYGWVAMLMIVSAGRYLHYRSYLSQPPRLDQMEKWYNQFRIGSQILSGVVGSAGFLLFVYDSTTYQLVLALMIVCIAAFAITTISPSPDLVISFLLLLLVPLTGSLLLRHGLTEIKALWIMPAVTIMLIVSALRISHSLRDNMELTVKAQLREKDVKNFQQRLSLYVEQLPLTVLELSPSSTIVQWNPAAERLFGYSKEEAEGRNMVELLASSRSVDKLQSLWDDISRTRSSQQFVVENRCNNGSLRQCEWIATPLIDTDGNIMALIALIEDITEKVENERLKQEFISIVSHELRTPVTSIKGSLALLTSGIMADEPDKSRELMHLALDNTNRLHLLINDILDVQKLEAGRMDYRFVDTDVGKLIHQVVDANNPLALNSNVQLVCKLPEIPVISRIDPDRIFQVLTNILANAIKFSRTDTHVTISLEKSGTDRVRIGVRNFGEVIPDRDRARLFHKFSQRDSTATRAKGGTGLGLYICQKILAEHNSKLDFTSTEEDGTLFFFSLSLVSA